MASQLYGVTGSKGLFPNQIAELNQRMGGLSSLLALQQTQKQFEADQEFKQKQLDQEKEMADDAEDFEEDQQQKEFGLEMGKLGFNLATGGGKGGPTFGEMGSWGKKPTMDATTPKFDTGAGTTTPKTVTPDINYSGADLGAKSAINPGGGGTGGSDFTGAKEGINPAGDGTNLGGGGNTINPTDTGGGFFSNIQPGQLLTGGLTGFGIGSMFADEPPEKRAFFGAGAGLLTGLLSGGGWSGMLTSGLGGLFGGLAAT